MWVFERRYCTGATTAPVYLVGFLKVNTLVEIYEFDDVVDATRVVNFLNGGSADVDSISLNNLLHG